jgi:hypothetical protein
MGKQQELINRKNELTTQISQLWDELLEVDEYIAVVRSTGIGEKIQAGQHSPTINLHEVEINLRDAALRRASRLFSETLSELEEVRPECPNCGEIMKKKISESSK